MHLLNSYEIILMRGFSFSYFCNEEKYKSYEPISILNQGPFYAYQITKKRPVVVFTSVAIAIARTKAFVSRQHMQSRVACFTSSTNFCTVPFPAKVL